MGTIYTPKHAIKESGSICKCKTPAVNTYCGRPGTENKGYLPEIGLIWECDECGKYWKSVKHKVDDYYNSNKSWVGRKFVNVRWYHWISWGRINRHKRNGVEL